MRKEPVDQIKSADTWTISGLAVFHKTVNFGAMDAGGRSGADVSCAGVNVGDVILGVGFDGDAGDDVRITGSITSAGNVRLTASYEGYLTDGANPPSLVCNIVVCQLKQ
jgi:hypothetical protein